MSLAATIRFGFDEPAPITLRPAVLPRSDQREAELQRELDIALFENFCAREPARSVLFWKGAGL